MSVTQRVAGASRSLHEAAQSMAAYARLQEIATVKGTEPALRADKAPESGDTMARGAVAASTRAIVEARMAFAAAGSEPVEDAVAKVNLAEEALATVQRAKLRVAIAIACESKQIADATRKVAEASELTATHAAMEAAFQVADQDRHLRVAVETAAAMGAVRAAATMEVAIPGAATAAARQAVDRLESISVMFEADAETVRRAVRAAKVRAAEARGAATAAATAADAKAHERSKASENLAREAAAAVDALEEASVTVKRVVW